MCFEDGKEIHVADCDRGHAHPKVSASKRRFSKSNALAQFGDGNRVMTQKQIINQTYDLAENAVKKEFHIKTQFAELKNYN